MARMISKKLTREMLEEMGIYDVYWDVERGEWWIDRYWFNCYNSKNKTHKRVNITLAVTHHKYADDKVYPKVAFTYGNKTMTYPLSRFLYAWFNKEVPEGLVVDHIDNDPFNNSLSNLQLLTYDENLQKRYEDREIVYKNQYDARR